MSPERLHSSVVELVELAQAGGALQVVEEVDRLLATGVGVDQPGLHYAKAVALDALGELRAAVGAATSGIEAAEVAGRDGWRAALLALRALELLGAGSTRTSTAVIDLAEGAPAVDEGTVLRDLAEAQVALSRGVSDVLERVAAHCALAETYTRLRMYELAVPMYLASYLPADGAGLPPEAPVIQQLNLATLHLTWAFELFRIGSDEADGHCATAGVHARAAQRVAAGEHAGVWAARGRALAAGADARGSDPPAAVRAGERALEELRPVGNAFETVLIAPFLAVAEGRAGRAGQGLARLEAALAAVGPTTDPTVVAALHHAQLVLLAPSDAGARAGLAYGEVLSLALWRQRARRLSAAEEVLRYERLRSDHEEAARSSEVDPLTGTATRRSLDRRAAVLEGRRREHGAPVCVLVVDVDGLKQINDGAGHLAGDEALRGVGQALHGCTRDGDLVARFGGDEFVALLSAEAASGAVVAERMLQAVRRLPPLPGRGTPVTVSVGLALTGPDRPLAATLAAADRAMYVAKRAGGDAVATEPDPPSGR